MSDNDPPDKIPEDHDLNETNFVGDGKSIPPSGKRFALRNVRRQLNDEELAQSGTQKMLLDMLEESENEKDNLKSYVASYHESDKQCAILGEKLNQDRSIEVFFGSGVGLGGAIFGLAPYFWDKEAAYGIVCLVIGSLLIIGASIGRAIKK